MRRTDDAASLRDALGVGYDVRYPPMPSEVSPKYGAWKAQIATDLATMDGLVILVGHSLDASLLLRYVVDEQPQ